MMTRYEIDSPTEEDVLKVAENMRQEDCMEVWASGESTPLEALREAISNSPDPKVGRADGEPIVIWGISPVTFSSDKAVVWLLSTPGVEKHFRVFLRACKLYVKYYNDQYPLIYNYVDARYDKAIRWLKWLGFEFDEARPYGKQQLPFHFFKMERQ